MNTEVSQALENYLTTQMEAPPSSRVELINDDELIESILDEAGPHLDSHRASVDLKELYTVAWHWATSSLIIASRGATLFCLSPKTSIPHLVFHRGIIIYRPGLGVEMVNVGIVGDVYTRPIVVRAESACSPSFLFGSQRCNCNHQWDCVRELAATFNTITPPELHNGHDFEQWVQQQIHVHDNTIHVQHPGERGFVMIHLDCQNGMGSGYSPGEFVTDLYSRASMRHRGEYSCEQVFQASMAKAFTSLGLQPDPRHQEQGLGYQTSFIVLDFLDLNPNLLFLSNNSLKWEHSLAAPYHITPVALAGEINLAGAEEAASRQHEFGHHEIATLVDFERDYVRLVQELQWVN